MKRTSVSPIGALHPILFFAGVYVVVLFFSIFICSALFYSCNTTSGGNYSSTEKKVNESTTNTVAITSIK
jgi:hypothetical protein